MKPRPVKGLDGERPVLDNARRILRVRLDELRSFEPVVRDPWQSTSLHDARIAAKRVRYVLEILGPALGPEAEDLQARAKGLQDLLGELHDCDVLAPRLERLARELRAQDALAINQRANDAEAVVRSTAAASNGAMHRGIAVLRAAVEARRAHLHREFLDRWDEFLLIDATALVGEAGAPAAASPG